MLFSSVSEQEKTDFELFQIHQCLRSLKQKKKKIVYLFKSVVCHLSFNPDSNNWRHSKLETYFKTSTLQPLSKMHLSERVCSNLSWRKKRHQSPLHILGKDIQNETRCYSSAAGRTQAKNMTVKLNFREERQEMGRTKPIKACNSESKGSNAGMVSDVESSSCDNSGKTTGQKWSTEAAF